MKTHSVEIDEAEGRLLVRTELIPYRLGDVENLTDEEALYVGLFSLIGYRYVFELCQCRLFSVSDSMIGFTPSGNVKVWINPDFSINETDKETFKYFRANPGQTPLSRKLTS